MENHQAKVLSVLILFTLIFGGILFWQKGRENLNVLPPEVSLASVEATPEPAAEVKMTAPNGKDTLAITERKVSEGTNKTFLITNEKRDTYEIFSKTVPADTILSVPFNTFSPDNKYIFLKEENQWGVNFFVVPASKDSLQKTATVFTELFRQKYPGFVIEDVTGWGGMTLIVINAKDEKNKGVSFWYDVSGGSFIRLSNHFE